MSELHDRETAVFTAARQLPAGQRAAFLEEACAGDPALRLQVEELLKAGEEAGDFLESPFPDAVQAAATGMVSAEKPGDRIGRYQLLEQIGEGGCGVVYLAEQLEPVRRRVALKVIKLGMDTKSVIARFEAERQALALMDHPGIAKVLDAGATEAGRPYFVMELVHGTRITEYCDQNNLSTRERLDLFVKVCQAIQHAHQKGVIHRDIKPSNILVTMNDGEPLPKVIDFGIAKATRGKLTDQTLFTAFEQFIGTPAYMSPEQAGMNATDIDTRSDIYSLGVLLYELLTGRTPFDAKELVQSGLDEISRTIREKEPMRPSTRLKTMQGEDLAAIATQRQAEPPRLIHLVRGDLDWIVMKALEKDRKRRYESASGLAADIQRHLGNEPVAARPQSNLYRFQKWARRNKLIFFAISTVAAALLIGITVSLWQARRAIRAGRAAELAKNEALAEAERATRSEILAAQQVRDFQAVTTFLAELFKGAKVTNMNAIPPVSEILRAAAATVETNSDIAPERKASLQCTLAETDQDLSLYGDSIPLLVRSIAYYRANLGPEDAHTLSAVRSLAWSYEQLGRNEEALKLREELLNLYRKVGGAEDYETIEAMRDLAESYCNTGSSQEGIALLARACDLSPGKTIYFLTLAARQVWFGQYDDYESTRHRLIQRQDITDAGQAEQIAKIYCLRPSTDAVLQTRALKLAERSVELETNHVYMPWHQLALGMAQYRIGQFANAEHTLADAEQSAIGTRYYNDFQPTARLYRAMSVLRQGRPGEARELITQAAALMYPLPTFERKPLLKGLDSKRQTHDVLISWLAYKEATSLLSPVAAIPPNLQPR